MMAMNSLDCEIGQTLTFESRQLSTIIFLRGKFEDRSLLEIILFILIFGRFSS